MSCGGLSRLEIATRLLVAEVGRDGVGNIKHEALWCVDLAQQLIDEHNRYVADSARDDGSFTRTEAGRMVRKERCSRCEREPGEIP